MRLIKYLSDKIFNINLKRKVKRALNNVDLGQICLDTAEHYVEDFQKDPKFNYLNVAETNLMIAKWYGKDISSYYERLKKLQII